MSLTLVDARVGLVQSQVIVLENQDLMNRPQETMDTLCNFLEIAPMNLTGDVQNEIGKAYV